MHLFLYMWRKEKKKTEKNPRSGDENQQQTYLQVAPGPGIPPRPQRWEVDVLIAVPFLHPPLFYCSTNIVSIKVSTLLLSFQTIFIEHSSTNDGKNFITKRTSSPRNTTPLTNLSVQFKVPMKWNFRPLFYSRKLKSMLHWFIIFEFKLWSGAQSNFFNPPKLPKNTIVVSEAWN